jgi:hypothetical protein
MRRSLRWLLAMVTFVGVAVTVFPAPALAAGCSSSGCVGHDPNYEGCDWNSVNYALYRDTDGAPIANVWNYYSYNCVANWAEASLTAAGKDRGFGLRVMIRTASGQYMCSPGPDNTGQWVEACYSGSYYYGTDFAWTDMVDGALLTHAEVCVTKPDWHGADICSPDAPA